MSKKLSVLLAGSLAGVMALSMASCTDYKAEAYSDPDETVTIDLTGDTNEISDTLFGIFLEDINYASYVMDDNLIMNGSFESTHNKAYNYGWSGVNATLTQGTENGALSSLNEVYSAADTNPNYGIVTVNTAGGGVSNTGYDTVPIAIEKGTQYEFSAFIKTSDDLVMTVEVSGKSQTVLSQEIKVTGNGTWTKYTQTIKATGTADSGLTFYLYFNSAATVCIDAVSLETTDSTLGIKNYVYNALADLSPKFIRFPGGCITEGNGYYNQDGETSLTDVVYDWKNSIGCAVTGDDPGDDDVPALTYTEVNNGKSSTVTTYGEQITRTPNQDLWGGSSVYYDMEYGIGFYEYFLLCDALGASAVPVLNCGLSCQGGGASNPRTLKGRHGNEVDDFIQDALDLVAFAKGDPNSSDANEAKWAQIRVNLGHEEPFEMTYLGIGNEQWGIYYASYYEYFVEAFKDAAKENPDLYGDIQLIVGNGTQLSGCEGYNGQSTGLAKTAATTYRSSGKITNLSEYGVHDHHYYRNYTEFLKYHTLYDNYSREEADKYYVFVGEYSANSATTQAGTTYIQTNNSWVTALSEAAYMTGLERNGDIVKLAAYAPVFGNADYSNQWAADMIFYTNTDLILTPNYYVQQIYMQNQGSYTVEYDVDYASGYESTYQVTSGNNYTTVDKVYRSVSVDEETGDLIVKIINAYSEAVKVNVSIENGGVKSSADVYVLQNDSLTATSNITGDCVAQEHSKVGVSSYFGYEAPQYSVTVIRLHLK